MNKSLVIWFKDGKTAYFEQVTNFVEFCSDFKADVAYIKFSYFGVTSQVKRAAQFNLNQIAGYAIEN